MTALRKEALDAKNDPKAENAFRQYRLNQRVNAATRWLSSLLWRTGAGLMPSPDKLAGRPAFGGLDLSATSDLTALSWVFPDRYVDDGQPVDTVARYWANEASVAMLDKATAGAFNEWISAGLVTITEGDSIDYDAVWSQLERDAQRFNVETVGLDRWNSQSTVNFCDRNGIQAETITQGYPLTGALREIERLLKDRLLNHGGHPVTTWCAECTTIRRRPDDEAIKLVKPDRDATGKRIDGIAALSFAVDRWLLDLNTPRWNLAEQVF